MTEQKLKNMTIKELCKVANNYKFSLKNVIIKAILEHVKTLKTEK